MAWCVVDQNGTPQLETARRSRMISLSVWIDEVGRSALKRDWAYWVGEGYSCRRIAVKVQAA